jgi:hypothetical protein
VVGDLGLPASGSVVACQALSRLGSNMSVGVSSTTEVGCVAMAAVAIGGRGVTSQGMPWEGYTSARVTSCHRTDDIYCRGKVVIGGRLCMAAGTRTRVHSSMIHVQRVPSLGEAASRVITAIVTSGAVAGHRYVSR